MASASGRKHALVAAWLALLLLACLPARAAENYLTASGEAADAIARIVEARGGKPEVHAIRLSDKAVTVLVRAQKPDALDEWTVEQTSRLLFFSAEALTGPTARPPSGIVPDVASRFFALDAVALDKADRIASRAIAYAKLEGEAKVQSIEIARRVHLLPSPSYGDIRWSIHVASPNERATVYADAKGEIIGGDLANTRRAQSMHFLNDDDWPKEAALEGLVGVVGGAPIVRDVTVYPKSVQVKADHPTLADTSVGYSWDISGVTRSPVSTPMFPGRAQQPAFSLADVDLGTLGKVRDAAKKAWGNDKSTMSYMMLRLFSEGPGKPELRWTVSFTDWGQPGEMTLFTASGTIDLTTDGTVRAANLPAARQLKRNWLDPKTTLETLAAVGEQFGRNARFSELSFSRDSLRILAEVPDAPGTMREYNATGRGITASSMMMPWDAEFRPETLYRMSDLSFFTAEKLAELTARTFSRLHVGEEMPLSRYTFSIGQLPTPDGTFMVPSPDGKVTLEIRLESPDGWKGGRVTYSSTGEEIDIVMP